MDVSLALGILDFRLTLRIFVGGDGGSGILGRMLGVSENLGPGHKTHYKGHQTGLGFPWPLRKPRLPSVFPDLQFPGGN